MIALLSRRSLLAMALATAPSLALANAVSLEPFHLKVTWLRLSGPKVRHRFVHISDLHHRNDYRFTENIVQTVQREEPEFVCFTGDLIDSIEFITWALDFVNSLGCPVFGIPGNHDHWRMQSFRASERAFTATGGACLMDRGVTKAGRPEITVVEV